MAYMLDGANLVDPGNDGTQIANINQDMVANAKVLMSNYGSEYAKGLVIFQAFSKSGGKQFHGEGYLYTHSAVAVRRSYCTYVRLLGEWRGRRHSLRSSIHFTIKVKPAADT